MTISATTQGIKPGVCLSTAKPVAPFDGQVIYMTDVDQTAVWDGTAWTVLAPIAGGRNVVINGAMQVAQRGTSTASITAGGYYTADRWFTNIDNTIGTWTQSIENDAPTGSGFIKSLKMLVTTANSALDANDFLNIDQRLEGQNLQQFLKGTASAKQFSISFWVKSNVTGTYIAELRDASNTRAVSASYTISASATWEKKTITFPADTTGAFVNDNSGALRLGFGLAMGSTYTSGTLATTWVSITQSNRYAGQTNLAAATNNYWQITGVQLEASPVATPFEVEDYGTTLQKCLRYYETGESAYFYQVVINGTWAPWTERLVHYKVRKRTTGVISVTVTNYDNSAAGNGTVPGSNVDGFTHRQAVNNTSFPYCSYTLAYTVNSEL